MTKLLTSLILLVEVDKRYSGHLQLNHPHPVLNDFPAFVIEYSGSHHLGGVRDDEPIAACLGVQFYHIDVHASQENEIIRQLLALTSVDEQRLVPQNIKTRAHGASFTPDFQKFSLLLDK